MSRSKKKYHDDQDQDQDQEQDQDQNQKELQAQAQGQLQGQSQFQLAVQQLKSESRNENDNENDNDNNNENKNENENTNELKNDLDNYVDNDLDNEVDNDVDNKVENSVDNKVENDIENKVENIVETKVDVDVNVDLDLDSDAIRDNDVIDIDWIKDIDGSVVMPDVVTQTLESGNQFNIDQVNNLVDKDFLWNPEVKNDGSVDWEAKGEGGRAEIDDIESRLDGNGNTLGDVGTATADGIATQEAFTQNIVMGANIQFNSIEISAAGDTVEESL